MKLRMNDPLVTQARAALRGATGRYEEARRDASASASALRKDSKRKADAEKVLRLALSRCREVGLI